MLKGLWLQHAFNYALCILAFAIPFPYIYSSIAVILLCIVWLLQFNPKQFLHNIKKRKVIWLWILFFLLHAVSYTYSIDKHEAGFDLQRKLSFVVFPLTIGTNRPIEKRALSRIFLFYILGITIVGLYCLGRAYLIYHYTGDTEQFFYHPLIKGFSANAVYNGLYSLFAIVILLFFSFERRFMRFITPLLAIIQITFFLLLSSRTLIIIFFVLILPLYIINLFLKKGWYLVFGLLLLIGTMGLAAAIIKTDNPIKKRYQDILGHTQKIAWTMDYRNSNEKEFNNLTLRLFLWNVGIDNIKEHNLWLKGAGNGSVYYLQNKKMTEYGVKDIYNEQNRSPLYNINLHNMYIQTLMMIGIPGLILFICIVFSPFFSLRRTNYKIITFLFATIMVVLMMQEASLQTQAGIIFYTLFFFIFYNVSFRKENQIATPNPNTP